VIRSLASFARRLGFSRDCLPAVPSSVRPQTLFPRCLFASGSGHLTKGRSGLSRIRFIAMILERDGVSDTSLVVLFWFWLGICHGLVWLDLYYSPRLNRTYPVCTSDLDKAGGGLCSFAVGQVQGQENTGLDGVRGGGSRPSGNRFMDCLGPWTGRRRFSCAWAFDVRGDSEGRGLSTDQSTRTKLFSTYGIYTRDLAMME